MGDAPLPESALQHLAFLAGHWRGELPGGIIEELWLAPAAGIAQGSVRYVQGGRIHTIELIVVAAAEGRVVMRYHHFNPDLTPWEEDGPIALTLVEAGPTKAVFRNLRPSRATPWRWAIACWRPGGWRPGWCCRATPWRPASTMCE